MNPTPSSEPAERCRAAQAAKKEFLLSAKLAAVMPFYLVSLYLLKHHPEWSPLVRVGVSLAPVIAGAFYIHGWMRWVSGLDELQRRIQLEGLLFGALGTVLVCLVISVLNSEGVPTGQLQHGLGVGGSFMVIYPLYLVGTAIARLRFV